jgi:hypothetical protein
MWLMPSFQENRTERHCPAFCLELRRSLANAFLQHH